MKRLTAQQVHGLRQAVRSCVHLVEENLRRARDRDPVDPKEVAFYEERLRINQGLAEALPERGGVEVEDDVDDEQRDEDEE